MGSIALLTRPGETIHDSLIVPGSIDDPSQYILGPSSHGVLGTVGSPYLIHPESGPTISNALFRSHMQPLIHADPIVDHTIFDSIDEFGTDVMLAISNIATELQVGAETGFKSAFSSVSGHVGGGASVIRASLTDVLKSMKELNDELHKYANSHNLSKHAAKQSVRQAYANMQKEFNFVVDQTVKHYKGGRESALLSMRRGIKVADKYKHRALPLNSLPEVKNLTKTFSVARKFAHAGLVLDLGFRIRTVEQAFSGSGGTTERGVRAAIEEASGFIAAAATSGFVFSSGSAFLCAFMGPAGLVPVIVLTGSAGVLADKGGREFGRFIGDLIYSGQL